MEGVAPGTSEGGRADAEEGADAGVVGVGVLLGGCAAAESLRVRPMIVPGPVLLPAPEPAPPALVGGPVPAIAGIAGYCGCM